MSADPWRLVLGPDRIPIGLLRVPDPPRPVPSIHIDVPTRHGLVHVALRVHIVRAGPAYGMMLLVDEHASVAALVQLPAPDLEIDGLAWMSYPAWSPEPESWTIDRARGPAPPR